MGVQKRNVPHFKGLICAKVDLEAQGRESTFTFCYAQLKKAILHHTRASGRFILSSTVYAMEFCSNYFAYDVDVRTVLYPESSHKIEFDC